MIQAELPNRTGIIGVAIREGETGRFLYNPKTSTVFRAGDIFLTLRDLRQIESLRKIMRG